MNTRRDLGIAYLLLIVGGVFGVHKFYVNRPALGVIYFFTGGLFLVGVIYDAFNLPDQVECCNRELAARPDAPPTPDIGNKSIIEATRKLERFTQRLDNLETLVHAQRSRG